MNVQGVDSSNTEEIDIVCIHFATQAYENCLDYLNSSQSWKSRKSNDISTRCIENLKKLFDDKLQEKGFKNQDNGKQ